MATYEAGSDTPSYPIPIAPLSTFYWPEFSLADRKIMEQPLDKDWDISALCAWEKMNQGTKHNEATFQIVSIE